MTNGASEEIEKPISVAIEVCRKMREKGVGPQDAVAEQIVLDALESYGYICYEKARADERERCALVAESFRTLTGQADNIASEIRNKLNQKGE